MHRSIYSYDRKKLYKEVWNEPMVVVSKRYGISNTALKKACIKLQIPTPGPGYWTIKRSGGQVQRTPLPKYTGPKLISPKEYTLSSFFNDIDNQLTKSMEEINFKKLESEALDWQRATTIREYIRAVEIRILTLRIPSSEKNKIRKQIQWAKNKADWLDPLTAAKDPLLWKRHYKRLFFDFDKDE